MTIENAQPTTADSSSGNRFKIAARCHRVKTNGDRCGSPARRGSDYCHFHHSVSRRRATFEVPVPEDGNAIQLGVYTMIQAILDERLDTKRINSVLYALQIAKSNLRNVDLKPAEPAGSEDAEPELDQPAA